MAQLFVLSGPDVGRSFTLKHGDAVGRSPECPISLKHASISRHHAHFEREGEQWFVVDDGSRNGIHHGRQRVARLALHDQLEFQLGELLLRFRAEGAAIAAPAPKPAAAPAAAHEPDELRLEGPDELTLDGEDEPARPPPPPVPRPRPEPEASASPIVLRAPPPAAPPPTATAADTGFGRAPAAAGAAVSRGKERAGERVLQYHKVENKGGLAHADLAQLSGPVKWTLVLIAVAAMAVLAWLAFSGTSFLKERLAGESAEELGAPAGGDPEHGEAPPADTGR